jgi:PTH1 family peptidyl-tRNA hydrolase
MLVIVYDDIDLPFGELRLSYDKSGGSHNGVLSVVKQLATQKFVVLRVGVSPVDSLGKIRRPTGKGTVERFVLKDFNSEELKTFDELGERAEKIMVLLGTIGLQKTLSVYKTKTTKN